MTRTRPRTLTSYIQRQSSRSASSTRSAPTAPPALLTSTWQVGTAAARAATESASWTSQLTATPPISAASSSMRSVRRAAHTTRKPSAARARAVAAPMPLEAPVTTAVRVWVVSWLMCPSCQDGPVIIAAADGSALGNPGPAGWAWYVDDDCWASGGWPHGTNNMGELMAVLDLLQQTAHLDEPLQVYCDSTYVINAVTKWMKGWKRKGWKKGDGKPVMNVELMKALDAAMEGRWDSVEFVWVKGHAGHVLNEAADVRANAAATAFRDGRLPDPGPGFAESVVAHPAASVGQVEPEPDLFSGLDAEDAAPPTRSTSSPWSAHC